MNKTIEERKIYFEKTLIEAFTEKPSKWYQPSGRYSYKTTNQIVYKSKLDVNIKFPIIIKNEFKEYKAGLIATFIISILCSLVVFCSNDSSNVLVVIFPFAFFFYMLKCALKKETYITITKEGILIEKENIGIIKWENIFASYILTEQLSESELDYLLLFHYDTATDTFLKTEYELKYQGFNIPNLCFYIEYWRIKTKNKLNKTKEQPN